MAAAQASQPLRVLVAPNAFKDCLSARAAAKAIERGVVRGCARAQVELLPLADGGDGTLEVLLDACGGEEVRVETCDALGRPVSARLALLRGREPLTAVVELAEASGLCRLRPAERNPLLTSTRGFGVLIRAALDRGARRLLLCIGGSATNDGGAGMAAALGYRFFDAHGAPLEPRGDNLASIARIDATNLHAALADAEVLVACDVSNPLLGPRGATAVFAPQKGAVDAADRELLERGLANLAELWRRQLGRDVATMPGAGAAGGSGAGLVAFAKARLQPGFELVASHVGLEPALSRCDVVITGEGRFDASSAGGKAPCALARAAAARGVPVVVLAGSVAGGAPAEPGIAASFSVVPGPVSLEDALRDAADNLARAAEQVVRLLEAARRLRRE